jgi:hypothetical protein
MIGVCEAAPYTRYSEVDREEGVGAMTNDDIKLWLPPMLTLLGTLIVIVFTAWLNTRVVGAKIDALNARFDGVDKRFDGIERRFEGIERRFDAINTRFDDMRELWRAELHRVEEVLDARLKHLEER